MRGQWLREHRTQLRRVMFGVTIAGLFLFIWWSANLYRNRKLTEAIIDERYAAGDQREKGGEAEALEAIEESAQHTGADGTTATERGMDENLDPVLDKDLVVFQGKEYRRNSYVKAILCMGVDRSDNMIGTRAAGEAGQSDGVFLIAQDTARNTLKILMIPRDTMTEITVTDDNNIPIGTEILQLTLAYAYGDGAEGSCQNMVESTRKLLGGLPVDHYIAADTTVIADLNDAVGGVTVTVPTDGMEKLNPAFIKGNKVTLKGKQAESFIRYRDITQDFSALYRMDQQQEYITQYFRAVREKSKTDSRIVINLFDIIQDHMITDMGKELYLKLGVDALKSEQIDFYTVPGFGQTTEVYDIYHADRKALIPILLNLFYREM